MLQATRLDVELRLGVTEQIPFTVLAADGSVALQADVSEFSWHLKRADKLGSAYATKRLGEGAEWSHATEARGLITVEDIDTAELLDEQYWHCSTAKVLGEPLPVVEGDVTIVRLC